MHEDLLSPEQVEQFLRWNHLDVLPIVLSAMFTRISICFFLRRIFARIETWGRFLSFMINFIWVSNLPLIVGILFLCRPLGKVWHPSLSGECWPTQTFVNIGYWQGGKWYSIEHTRLPPWLNQFGEATSCFCDLTLALLPIVFLWNVQISFRIKAGICIIMGIGIL